MILNQKRIKKMPKEIKTSVFILTKELIEKNFKDELFDKKYAGLLNALKTCDYGAYITLCESFKNINQSPKPQKKNAARPFTKGVRRYIFYNN